MGRYLKKRPRVVIKYNWQSTGANIIANSDSDWAGDKIKRKSTSGGIIRIGNHFIKSWSKNQSVIALSSAEAELYAIIKTSSGTLGIMSILKDRSLQFTADIMADASAALGIIGRSGLGKLRQVDTSYLWLQQDSIKNKLKMNKVKGTSNPADMNTKGLSGEEILKYTRMLNMEYQEGRAELAPEVHQMLKKQNCKRFNSTSSKVTHKTRIRNEQQSMSAVPNKCMSEEECICGCEGC